MQSPIVLFILIHLFVASHSYPNMRSKTQPKSIGPTCTQGGHNPLPPSGVCPQSSDTFVFPGLCPMSMIVGKIEHLLLSPWRYAWCSQWSSCRPSVGTLVYCRMDVLFCLWRREYTTIFSSSTRQFYDVDWPYVLRRHNEQRSKHERSLRSTMHSDIFHGCLIRQQ